MGSVLPDGKALPHRSQQPPYCRVACGLPTVHPPARIPPTAGAAGSRPSAAGAAPAAGKRMDRSTEGSRQRQARLPGQHACSDARMHAATHTNRHSAPQHSAAQRSTYRHAFICILPLQPGRSLLQLSAPPPQRHGLHGHERPDLVAPAQDVRAWMLISLHISKQKQWGLRTRAWMLIGLHISKPNKGACGLHGDQAKSGGPSKSHAADRRWLLVSRHTPTHSAGCNSRLGPASIGHCSRQQHSAPRPAVEVGIALLIGHLLNHALDADLHSQCVGQYQPAGCNKADAVAYRAGHAQALQQSTPSTRAGKQGRCLCEVSA